MYRVILVDDEPNILDGMIALLSTYEKYELDIIKCTSGEEALNILSQNKIDLIISDIVMGEVSGLQLAQEAALMWNDSRIILLTGHHNFDYIYRSAQLSHVRYILKSEKDETLLQAITEALDEIHTDLSRRTLLNKAQSLHYELEKVRYVVRHELLSLLMSPRPDIGKLRKSRICYDPSKPVLAFATVKNGGTSEDVSIMAQLLEGLLGQLMTFDYFPHDDHTVFWILQDNNEPSDSQSKRWRVRAKENLETVQNELKNQNGLEVSMIIGHVLLGATAFKDEFTGLRRISERIRINSHLLLFIDIMSEENNDLLSVLRENEVVDKINAYIREHIGGDLSLTKIAKTFHFNGSYLSRLYKANTGKNIMDVINETKYEISKDLLANTDLKINEIALKVGFDSPSYFTFFFKKMANLSPKEFRASDK